MRDGRDTSGHNRPHAKITQPQFSEDVLALLVMDGAEGDLKRSIHMLSSRLWLKTGVDGLVFSTGQLHENTVWSWRTGALVPC